MKRSIIGLLLFVASFGQAQEREHDQATTPVGPLSGAWNVTLTPGEGGPPPFAMLMLFTRDGGVVQTDAGPPNPLQFSPGIGEWKRTNRGTFAASYTQLEFDSGQVQVGVFRGSVDVTLDEAKDTFSGTARVRFYDTNGVLLFEADGTVEGKRMPIE